MAVAPTVEAVVQAGGAHIPPLLAAVEERLAALAAGHGHVLARHAGDTIAAGGKRLRPLLVLVVAGQAARPSRRCGRRSAVELIHSATLVHDDVLDAAALRRGRPTVVATAGRGMATATGDLLFSRAFAELAANGRAGRGARAVRRFLRARPRESCCSARTRSTPGSPSSATCAAASSRRRACSRRPAGSARWRRRAAWAIPRRSARSAGGSGLAFQLLDDVLDVSGPAARTGKARGADLLDGTVTLPLILARERDPELAGVDLRGVVSPSARPSCATAIEATGVLAEARGRALEVVAEAKGGLPALDERRARGARARRGQRGAALRLGGAARSPSGGCGRR